MRRREAVAALVAGFTIVLALMAVFAIELSDNQAKSKGDVESRVHERSVLAAALIDSLFQTSASTSLAQQQRLFGSGPISRRTIDRAAQRDRYIVVLDASGAVVGASRGFTPQARAGLRVSAALALLRSGHPWSLGDVLPYGKTGVIDFGLALHAATGTRYLLSGFDPHTLGPFLQGELREIPGVKGAHNYVLDGADVVLSSTNPARPAGYVFHTPAQRDVLHHAAGDVKGYYFDQVRLANTSWRILLAAPDGPLFASISGLRKWLPWAIFLVLGIVAFAALGLGARWLRASRQVSEANARLERANGKLAQANARMGETNAALADSNAELDRRARELSRSNADLEMFASIASHDLQEPLRKVRTYTERIWETEAERLSGPGLDYLQRANASAERMQRLIEDLLKYSRLSTHGSHFTAVDLQATTEDVLEDLAEVVRNSAAVVRVDELPTISADAVQMRQLIQNLLSNAIKFRRPDVTPEIEVGAIVDGDVVKLIVRDNGIGFESEYSRRIFRVFERLHGRGTYPGTGIGLALCSKIAERHGGTVTADSVPGAGSTFTVTMPTKRIEPILSPPLHRTSEGERVEPYVTV